MAKIVVIGAGIGGCPMAFELKEKLGRAHDIHVVATSDWFQFIPSNPWVAVNCAALPGDLLESDRPKAGV